jgi:putative endonuclease
VDSYFCYIIECNDGSYYTGWTTDPARRVREHAAGRGARYTRAHPPKRLVFLEPQPDRATAMRRERALKTMSRARKDALIAGAAINEEIP